MEIVRRFVIEIEIEGREAYDVASARKEMQSLKIRLCNLSNLESDDCETQAQIYVSWKYKA